MSKWSQQVEDMHRMQCQIQDTATVFGELIDHDGRMLVPASGPTRWEEVVSDYYWFCLAKATKTLLAADLLLTEMYFEDVKTLVRCAYECYLNAAYLTANPTRVVDLVPVKVRLHHGTLQHPLSRSGKKIRSRALDQKTGDVRDYQITIEEMAKSTGFASDANVHYPLYQFLSEFTHVHIMAIGAYANEKEHRFTIKSDAESAYATVFLASYCTWLLLDLVRRRFTVADASKLMTLSSELRTSLLSGLKSMDFAPQLQELPTSITERLSH